MHKHIRVMWDADPEKLRALASKLFDPFTVRLLCARYDDKLSFISIAQQTMLTESVVSYTIYRCSAELYRELQTFSKEDLEALTLLEFHNSPISKLRLSRRASNALHRANIHTVSDVKRSNLYELRGIGHSTVSEIMLQITTIESQIMERECTNESIKV